MCLELHHISSYTTMHTRIAISCHDMHSMRREFLYAEYSIGYSTQAAPYTHTRRNRLCLLSCRGGSLDCMWGVQAHIGPTVFLVLFCKDFGQDVWHTTTKSEMTGGAGNQTRISRSRALTIRPPE